MCTQQITSAAEYVQYIGMFLPLPLPRSIAASVSPPEPSHPRAAAACLGWATVEYIHVGIPLGTRAPLAPQGIGMTPHQPEKTGKLAAI